MTPRPNLGIAHVASHQNQKEITINDAVDALDNAENAVLGITLSDADYTLSATEANRNGLLIFTGTLTAARTVTLPGNARRIAVRNATSGGFALNFQYSGGTPVSVANAKNALLHGDGTNLYKLSEI